MPVIRNPLAHHSVFKTMKNKLLTISDFCEWANIKKNKAYEIINAGEISYIRTQGETGQIRFTHGHIVDWLRRQERKSKHDNL